MSVKKKEFYICLINLNKKCVIKKNEYFLFVRLNITKIFENKSIENIFYSQWNVLIQIAEDRFQILIVVSAEQLTNSSLDRIWIPVIAIEWAVIFLMQLFVSRHQTFISPLLDPLITFSSDNTLMQQTRDVCLSRVCKQLP